MALVQIKCLEESKEATIMALGHFGNFHPIDISGFASASAAASPSSSSSSAAQSSPGEGSSSDVLARLFAIRKRLQELSALEKRLEQLAPYCERYKVCFAAFPSRRRLQRPVARRFKIKMKKPRRASLRHFSDAPHRCISPTSVSTLPASMASTLQP